jgi:hypothetical protein
MCSITQSHLIIENTITLLNAMIAQILAGNPRAEHIRANMQALASETVGNLPLPARLYFIWLMTCPYGYKAWIDPVALFDAVRLAGNKKTA